MIFQGERSTALPTLLTCPPSWSDARGPTDWRMEGPNYFWPDDRGWIVATEIDGFSTYVGAPKEAIDRILASPLLEALPSAVTHRFDGLGDPINGPSP